MAYIVSGGALNSTHSPIVLVEPKMEGHNKKIPAFRAGRVPPPPALSNSFRLHCPPFYRNQLGGGFRGGGIKRIFTTPIASERVEFNAPLDSVCHFEGGTLPQPRQLGYCMRHFALRIIVNFFLVF